MQEFLASPPAWVVYAVEAFLLLGAYHLVRRFIFKETEPIKPAKDQLDEYKARREEARLAREAEKAAQEGEDKSSADKAEAEKTEATSSDKEEVEDAEPIPEASDTKSEGAK